MMEIIRARIEAGKVIPEGPLPEESEGQRVSILVERPEPPSIAAKEAALARLCGLLKGANLDDSERDYQDYLDRKYR